MFHNADVLPKQNNFFCFHQINNQSQVCNMSFFSRVYSFFAAIKKTDLSTFWSVRFKNMLWKTWVLSMKPLLSHLVFRAVLKEVNTVGLFILKSVESFGFVSGCTIIQCHKFCAQVSYLFLKYECILGHIKIVWRVTNNFLQTKLSTFFPSLNSTK